MSKRRPSRYPPIKKDDAGKYLCRGCGSAVPKGRQTWCSQECYIRLGDIQGIKRRTFERDEGRCQMCQRNSEDIDHDNKAKGLWYHPHTTWQKYRNFEYDHITPHCEGGLFEVSNLRTLCQPCHVKRTTQWRKERSQKQSVVIVHQAEMSL